MKRIYETCAFIEKSDFKKIDVDVDDISKNYDIGTHFIKLNDKSGVMFAKIIDILDYDEIRVLSIKELSKKLMTLNGKYSSMLTDFTWFYSEEDRINYERNYYKMIYESGCVQNKIATLKKYIENKAYYDELFSGLEQFKVDEKLTNIKYSYK